MYCNVINCFAKFQIKSIRLENSEMAKFNLVQILELWFIFIVDIVLDVNNKKPTVQKSLSDMTASIDISSHVDIVKCPHKISSLFNFRILHIFFRNYFIIVSETEWIMCISVIIFFSWIRAVIPFTHSSQDFWCLLQVNEFSIHSKITRKDDLKFVISDKKFRSNYS